MAAKPANERNDSLSAPAPEGLAFTVPGITSIDTVLDNPVETQVTHLEIARLIERSHRRFLDLLRVELTRLGTDDISPSQVMLLFTIGNDELSVRDLLERGHYLGSNASYNLKQLVEADYVHRAASQRDRRSARLRLTDKAQRLCDAVRTMQDNVHRPNSQNSIDANDLVTAFTVLRRLELLWTSALRYGETG
ncbi:MarR family winged helix-turn-helix transcriptional regulator [Ancylobacter pratisalsi]|uniref:Winged helix DNA-binding protein n=1 Tax=Ancylobacter pratisalsi TaxID=1745854 RepID=A0A6P1YPM4_9HYPH|nr:MarR family transcriptional regulator [Ancylobacter pratisalsi]QIB35427.1 winged helix DNA-binding protein [Ancylobacter pratisalsi]